VAKYTVDIDVNYKSVEDLKSELQALEAEFSTLSIGSDGFVELGNQIKGVKSQLKDVELQFEGLDKEQKATALVDTFTGLVGAVGAVSSAFIAFGADSDAIENAEKKLLGVIGVVNGLRDASNGLIALNKLTGFSFKTAFTTATGAVNTTKVALAGLGIGAIILAVTVLADTFDIFGTKATKNTKDAEAALDLYTRKIQLLANINENRYKDEIKAAQLAGKSEEEVNALRLKIRKEQNEGIQAEGKKLKLGQEKERAELIKVEKGYLSEIDALEVGAFKNQQALKKKASDDAKAAAKASRENEAKAIKEQAEAIRVLDEARATEGLDAITTQYANNLSRLKESQAEELKQINLTDAAKVAINAKYAAQIETNETNRVKDTDAFIADADQKALDNAVKQAEELKAFQEKSYNDELTGINEFYGKKQNEITSQFQQGLITQEQNNAQLQQLETDRLNNILQATKDAGQSTVDIEKQILEQKIAIKNKDVETTKATEQAKLGAQLEFAAAAGNAVGALAGLFEEGSNAAKAAALVDIAVGTGVGFIRALSIAQETAQATGPAAAFAFPIFYASQIAAVLGAASRAKAILSSGGSGGGGGSRPPNPPAPSVPSVTTSQGTYTPLLPEGTTGTGTGGQTSTGEMRGGERVVKTYVLAGDVTDAQQAEAQINQKRKF